MTLPEAQRVSGPRFRRRLGNCGIRIVRGALDRHQSVCDRSLRGPLPLSVPSLRRLRRGSGGNVRKERIRRILRRRIFPSLSHVLSVDGFGFLLLATCMFLSFFPELNWGVYDGSDVSLEGSLATSTFVFTVELLPFFFSCEKAHILVFHFSGDSFRQQIH